MRRAITAGRNLQVERFARLVTVVGIITIPFRVSADRVREGAVVVVVVVKLRGAIGIYQHLNEGRLWGGFDETGPCLPDLDPDAGPNYIGSSIGTSPFPISSSPNLPLTSPKTTPPAGPADSTASSAIRLGNA